MFFGRNEELSMLEKEYQKPGFQFAVIYGRRRIGKSSMVIHFLEKHEESRKIYFLASQSGSSINLTLFSKAIFAGLENNKSAPTFKDWVDLLDYLNQKVFDKKLILVIDEFSYLASSDPAFPSLLQGYVDKWNREGKNIFLILLGSSVSYMKNLAISYASPLYGRATSIMEIKPLSLKESSLFFPSMTPEQKVEIYSVFGGIPGYLTLIDEHKSVKQNIIDLIISQNGRFHDEIAILLNEELKEPSRYLDILYAISRGSNTSGKIAEQVHIPLGSVGYYLDMLERTVHFIKKIQPIGGKRKASIFVVSDPFLAFYFRFCHGNLSIIETIGAEDFYMNYLEGGPFLTFAGMRFETICKDFLIQMNRKKKLPILGLEIGKWWGPNPVKKEQTDIDVVVQGQEEDICCECKYQNRSLSYKEYLDFVKDSQCCLANPVLCLYLFLKTKPEERVIEDMKNNIHNRIFYVNDLFE